MVLMQIHGISAITPTKISYETLITARRQQIDSKVALATLVANNSIGFMRYVCMALQSRSSRSQLRFFIIPTVLLLRAKKNMVLGYPKLSFSAGAVICPGHAIPSHR